MRCFIILYPKFVACTYVWGPLSGSSGWQTTTISALSCEFLQLSPITWTPKVALQSFPLWNVTPVGMRFRLSCTTTPLWFLWDWGWWSGGWESRAQRARAAELFISPTLLASFPLCSASTETSITVWMKSLCLSPSLNLKCGVLCWFFTAICVIAAARYTPCNTAEYSRSWNWTELAWKM